MAETTRVSDYLRKIGYLGDRAESVFYGSKSLLEIGVNRLTPGALLYLLAKNENSRDVVGTLLGKDPKIVEDVSKNHVRQNPGVGNGKISFDPQIEVLIDEAVKKAGGKMNEAGPEHLLFCMFTMPGARHADSYSILKELKVDEKEFRKNFDTWGLLEDVTEKTGVGKLGQIETATAEKNVLNILSRLKRNPKERMLIVGEPGTGKHALMTSISRVMSKDKLPGLKLKKIYEIKVKGSVNKNVIEKLESIGNEKKDALFFLDLSNLTEKDASLIANSEINSPLIGISHSPLSGSEGAWETFTPSPYTLEEMSEIISQNLRVEAGEAEKKLGILDEAKITKLLIQYGPTIYRGALPGSAIELLKQIVADALIHGENEISPRKVAEVLSRQGANLSVDAMLKTHKERVLNVETVLNERVIGQNEAKAAIARALRIKAAELSVDKKPIANFVFLGPTGVGKTEMAKSLAYALFDNADNMIRIDMSEYQESHTVSRLIGSPPGYVGYDQGGQLTEAVSKQPFSVILFDEIDKAHPGVLNPLLQVLDEGRLTDGKGRTVDFSQAIIIMTSNHGSSLFYDALEKGQDIKGVRESVRKWFNSAIRPEFLNRIDQVVVFDPISKADAAKILDLMLEKLVSKNMKDKHNIKVEFAPEVKEALLKLGFTPELGARPLQRVINRKVLDPIASFVLKDGDKSDISFKLESEEIVLEALK